MKVGMEGRRVKVLAAAIALLLFAPGTAQAAAGCGRAEMSAGIGKLELQLWNLGNGAIDEHAILSVPARGNRFVMELTYKPARGQVGTPVWVQLFAYAPWQRRVRTGEILTLGAGRVRWRGPVHITGLSSRSGRAASVALYLIHGDKVQADPALLRAFAAGGKVQLARGVGDSRINDLADLPKTQALSKAYQAARAKAVAAMGPCPQPHAPPLTAP